MTNGPEGKRETSLLQQVEGAEKLFLSGRRNRAADLESAVRFFLEFLHGFESFEFQQRCVTVFGSARFQEDHRYYQLAREVGYALGKAGFAVMTSLATPIPPPPPAGELRKVKIMYRCSICGTEVRMTSANDEVPEAPRHCQEDMDLVAPID